MEKIDVKSNLCFINDSKGTNIDSTKHAIYSSKKTTILILGGYSKGQTNYKVMFNNNNRTIHDRTDFEDYEDPKLKRTLIRTWIRHTN